MPKAKWGDFAPADIDNAKSNEFTPYAGPIPKGGLFRFIVKQMKVGDSKGGNPMLTTIMELDGSWKPAHKKFDGCPLFDYMPVIKSTAFRTKAFCEAFGLTSREFTTGIITDENGKVTKLASAGDPAGLEVYVNVAYQAATDEYSEKIRLNGTGYLPVDDAPDDEAEDADPAEDDADNEPPF